MNHFGKSFLSKALIFTVAIASSSLCQAFDKQIMDSHILKSAETRTILETTGVLHSNLGPSTLDKNEYKVSLQMQRKHREHFDLLWSPLPLGFIYEPLSDQREMMAVSWNIETAYSTQTGFEADPMFRSFYRYRFSTTTAFSATLFYGRRYFFAKQNPNSWLVGTLLGPFFQLDPHWAMSFKGGMNLEEVRDESRWEVRSKEELADTKIKPYFPVQFELSRNFSERTQIEFEYNYSGLGRWYGLEVHAMTLRWQQDW